MIPTKNITHLVHIGFDPREFLDFEQGVTSHLEAISDNASHVLNFVDEAPYTLEDGELIQKNEFAESLAKFVAVCELKSTGMAKHLDFDRNLAEIPEEVVEFLRTELNGEWQALEQPVISFDEWVESKPGFAENPPANVQDDLDAHHAIKKSIIGDRFEEILGKMVSEFKGRNIFRVKTGEGNRNDDVKNPERKFRLIESAESLLGKGRVMFSGMRDGDLDKIHGAINGDKSDADFKEFLAESDIDYQDWEKSYGNATEGLTRENRDLSLIRAERYHQAFFADLKERGFSVTKDTQHTLGGEYYGRGVHSYGNNLLLYRVEQKVINISSGICLIKPGDEGKYNV